MLRTLKSGFRWLNREGSFEGVFASEAEQYAPFLRDIEDFVVLGLVHADLLKALHDILH